jgi:SnoaL-like domain
MKVKVSDLRDEIAEREAIRHCLMRYCRGIDRCDPELIRSVYWPDAVDHHLEFTGSPEEFIDYCIPLMQQGMDQTMHTLGNILISIDGKTAEVESYFQAFHRIKGSETAAAYDLIVAGRYLDVFAAREDEWRISNRLVVVDWFRQYPDSADWSAGPLGQQLSPGGRKPEDPSYVLAGLSL